MRFNVSKRKNSIIPSPLAGEGKGEGEFIMKNHLKHNLLYLIIFIITLFGCGSDMNTASNDTGDTGSALFSLKWDTPNNIPSPLVGEGKGEGGLPELSYAPIDCTTIGVSTENGVRLALLHYFKINVKFWGHYT